MPKYEVRVKEVHIQPYFVEAESEQEAIKVVEDGGGEIDESGFEYSCMLDSDEWNVFLVTDT